MGKGQAKAAERTAASQERIANRTLDIGESLLKEAKPARTTAQNVYTSTVKGGPDLVRALAPQLNAATTQYRIARRAANDIAPGGGRDQYLRDLALSEAGAKTAVTSNAFNEAVARLASMGWLGTQSGVGSFGQASSGLGQAGQTYANLANAKGQSVSDAAGGLGAVAGMFL